jgi:hypothetical protein
VLLLGCAYAEDNTAVPQLVKFSGTISGAPAGTIGVIFALYKDQTGGAPLWQEVQNITVDGSGHYNSLLGARSATGIPLDLFSNGEARWLGVQPEGQPEQARVLLVSVPYALKASDSETLGGLPASAFLRADAVTATASSTAPAAYVNTAAVNSAANRAAAAAAVTSNDTAGYLPVFTDSTGDLQNSALFQLNAGTTAAPVWNLGFGTVAPAFNLNFVSQVDPAAIAIDGYGAVGINFIGRRAEGTLAAPSAILSGDNILALQGRGYGATKFSTSSRAYMKFFAAENWTDAAQGTYISLATTATGTAAAAERLRITAAGNVGIGTTAPAYPLSVNGVIQSSAGGFRFPDNTVQTTAGVALSSPDSSITVGGSGAAPTVAVNGSVIQKRVGSSCSSGSAIAAISSTGTVSCQTVSGGGAISLPVNWSSATNPPSTSAGVLNVTNTATGPAAPQNTPTSSFFGTVPTAIAGTATGSQVAVGIEGVATGPEGIGVFAYSTTSTIGALLAWNGLTGYTPTSSKGDWPKAIQAELANAGGDVIEANADAATAPNCTQNSNNCMPTIGVRTKVKATTGSTEAFEGDLSSPSAVGLQLNFDVAPTSGSMISANVNCNGTSACPYFQVDGSGDVSFSGNLNVGGNISKGGGSFKIDHPLDPANKYLYHSFVESPDMKNVYDGLVVLNKKGEAVVELPDYFEALNQDFRYQLTSIGRFMPLYVAREIKGNKFTIAGGKPGAKVSWQVTGIRHDAYADAHRIQVEEDKGKERGTYMHPELFQKEPPALARK